MSGIGLKVFGGVKPRVDAHLLPDYLAQTAVGCRLTSGVLSPWRKFATINTPTKAGTKLSMYRIPYASVDYWLHWITDVNVVKSQIANDAFNRYYYTGDGAPKVTNDQIATQGAGTDYPLAWFTLGLPPPTTPTFGTINGGVGAAQTRSYVYTLVTTWGEEGPPSLPATATGKVDDNWTINLPTVVQPGGGTYQVATKNIYRTVTNADGTSSFLFVASVALNIASTSDAALDAALINNTVLPSTSWIAPPAGLQGLIALPNGSMAGFVNNQLCISEPFQPHAWPLKYRYSVDFSIVGIAANGSSVAVCTTAVPYVYTGSTPDGMVPAKGRAIEPCLSKRSVIDVGWGVLYASPNGLVDALDPQANVVTADSILSKSWSESYFPSTMIAAAYQGGYHAFYTTALGVGAGIIAARTAEFGFKQVMDYATAAWTDPTSGSLYLIISGAIVKWDADPNMATNFDWKSKKFIEKKPINYGAIKVEADYASFVQTDAALAQQALDRAYNANLLATDADRGELAMWYLGEIPLAGSKLRGTSAVVTGRYVQVEIYCNGVLKYQKFFTSDVICKLPSGFKHRQYEIRVTGNVDVYAVKIAENAKAIALL